MSLEILGIVLILVLFVAILAGFPISFTLFFLAMVFGYIGLGERVFYLMTYQYFNTMIETVLAAVALFTFMGYLLESSGLMGRLFHAVQLLFGRMHGSLYIATIIAATIFAAATGIVGASVAIIGLMAGPIMKKRGYDTGLSAGTICAGGTLGILIPPSVMLVVMGPSFQVSISRLYAAAILPGLLLAGLYIIYTMSRVWWNPKLGPPLPDEELNVSKGQLIWELVAGIIPPAFLILMTLGTIATGWATPTEGAALGCVGAIIICAANRSLTFPVFREAVYRTVLTTSMVMILVAASTFLGSVFSAFGTPKFLADTILGWEVSGGLLIILILAVCFILGWPLEWVPIVVIIIPIFLPLLQALQVDMVWFSILVAVTLQTCWLSPPVALSAYYLKAVVPGWSLLEIYRGMMPFMIIQWICVLLIYYFPQIPLYLPNLWYK